MTLNLDALNNIITSINDALWAYLLIGALILCGLYFTIRSRFVQFTMIGDMFRQLVDSSSTPSGKKHISSFQAFAVSMATRVGTGQPGWCGDGHCRGWSWSHLLDVADCAVRLGNGLCRGHAGTVVQAPVKRVVYRRTGLLHQPRNAQQVDVGIIRRTHHTDLWPLL